MADSDGDYVNLIKLCVGCHSVDELEYWQAERVRSGAFKAPEHVTRMRPKRAEEVLNGGSLYWVIRGYILARQRITGLERREGSDGITRCAIVFGEEIFRTIAVPRRPFQGWRYLRRDDSPPDLSGKGARENSLPPGLEAELSRVGVV